MDVLIRIGATTPAGIGVTSFYSENKRTEDKPWLTTGRGQVTFKSQLGDEATEGQEEKAPRTAPQGGVQGHLLYLTTPVAFSHFIVQIFTEHLLCPGVPGERGREQTK
jgi:hypothetical protein